MLKHVCREFYLAIEQHCGLGQSRCNGGYYKRRKDFLFPLLPISKAFPRYFTSCPIQKVHTLKEREKAYYYIEVPAYTQRICAESISIHSSKK